MHSVQRRKFCGGPFVKKNTCNNVDVRFSTMETNENDPLLLIL